MGRRKLTVREIKRAFATPDAFAGDVTKSPGNWESPEISEDFSNKHWKEMVKGGLIRNRLSLPHFTDEAYRYFLPTYLVVSIGHPEGGEVDGFTFYSLTPPKDSQSMEMAVFLKRNSGFTKDQLSVIRKFVLRFAEANRAYLSEADKRTEDFWDTYAPPALMYPERGCLSNTDKKLCQPQ